jgi:hypothetical protein
MVELEKIVMISRKQAKANQKLSIKRWNLRKSYGLSYSGYLELVEKHQGRCAICNKEKSLGVDHCHETKKVRGLLCNACNLGLGALGDTVTALTKALAYLQPEYGGINSGC